ncbi:MAG: polysaccharide deacetylase family protein [Bacteroidales bacterium]|nr:polysaccharide deacetylase family protein [Bacteroidales bacterium]
MKKLTLLPILLIFFVATTSSQNESIRLIVRGDDIGSTHAANLGCIRSYVDGIMTTVEVMVPCPWFPEAVKMLNENPGLDVGIHITVTSEWENYKWRPLTHSPSITDEDGYFFPMIWANDEFPPERALREQDWKIGEIEQEMRAQIEMAMKHIPHVSHLSCHMGCANWDDQVQEVFNKLAEEYNLVVDRSIAGIERFPIEGKGETLEERITLFVDALNKLENGKTYLFVEHPALDTPEMEAIGHSGYMGVGADRYLVTKVFTSEKVRDMINERNIKLIPYKDLVK